MYIQIPEYTKIYRKKNGGYIFNRKKNRYKYYDDVGMDWLHVIGRRPILVEDVVSLIACNYDKSLLPVISRDFYDFIKPLMEEEYILKTETPQELRDYNEFNHFSLNNNEKKLIEKVDTLTLEVTKQCNERCIHCYIPNERKVHYKSLSITRIKEIINDFTLMDGKRILLTGGEVLMHKDLYECINYSIQKKLHVTLLTNLTLLKDDFFSNFYKFKNDISFQVSLYSTNIDIHDAITKVKGSCLKTMSSINRLVSIGFEVHVSLPILKANKNSACEVIEYAKKWGLPLRICPSLHAKSDGDTLNLCNRLSIEEAESLIRSIINYDKEYAKSMFVSSHAKSAYGICPAATSECFVSAEGYVNPCPSWDLHLGDLSKDSLYDIWQSSPGVISLRHLTENDIKECIGCDAKSFCSRCLAANFNESNGNMLRMSKHLCELAHLLKKLYNEYYT